MTSTRARILVVDDDPDIRANLADILRDMDFEVDTAADGVAGLESIRAVAYDLVLLDLRMPGMDGLEVYRQLKRLRPGTPVIAAPRASRCNPLRGNSGKASRMCFV